MLKVDQLIVALRQAEQPCRRLDALATGYVFAPQGWKIEAEEGLDGWGIEYEEPTTGETNLWMCASDVGYLTRYIDAATEFVQAARPQDAAAITTNALARFVQNPAATLDMRVFVPRIACRIVAELLERIEQQAQASDPVSAEPSQALVQGRRAG